MYVSVICMSCSLFTAFVANKLHYYYHSLDGDTFFPKLIQFNRGGSRQKYFCDNAPGMKYGEGVPHCALPSRLGVLEERREHFGVF